jgi:AAA15 family ATPase/GTPase
MSEILESISIQGFKSIRDLDAFKFNHINVLIGSNGAGKSNFVSFFFFVFSVSCSASDSNSSWPKREEPMLASIWDRSKRKN